MASSFSKLPSGGSDTASLLPEPDYNYYFQDEQNDDEDDLKKDWKKAKNATPSYILGTLVVRVVAARNLDPVRQGGLTKSLLGLSARERGGTANPYASVRFMQQVQRTSEVYDSLDPAWPRGEAMFLDVSLPLGKVTHVENNAKDDEVVEAPPAASAATAIDIIENFSDEKIPTPIVTVALFHAMMDSFGGGKNDERYPTKKNGGVQVGDSNEPFLGMASLDVTPLLTGKTVTLDQWLPLSGTPNDRSRASVRLVCEYEPSDAHFRPGDVVRFTQWCNRADLFPVPPALPYRVHEVQGDNVIISYTSPEGWLCTFLAHRYMFICEERHHGAMEAAHDELASIAERLGKSPLLSAVTDTVDRRLPEDGLLTVGAEAVKEGASLINRWMKGGVDTAVGDIMFATNWDGRFNQENQESQESPPLIPSESGDDEGGDQRMTPSSTAVLDTWDDDEEQGEAIPGMPCCPITGEPMRDPVVAADGHTYERRAIARWLRTSDKSPLTGNVLPHKELVTNYGLLSSVQEIYQAAAAAAALSAPQTPPVGNLKDDDAYVESSVQEAHQATQASEVTPVPARNLKDDDLYVESSVQEAHYQLTEAAEGTETSVGNLKHDNAYLEEEWRPRE